MSARHGWWTPLAAGLALTLTVGAGCGGDDPPGPATDGGRPSVETTAGDPTDDTAALAGVAAETELVEPSTPLDDEARGAAATLQQQVSDTVTGSGWGSTADLTAAGFEPMPGDPVHWFDPAALADGVEVDPRHPEFVMVDSDTVVGVMFVAGERPDGAAPPDPPGAPLTRWHRHRWDHRVCLAHDALVVAGTADPDGRCPSGQEARTESPYMFHVWLEGDDPFSEEMAPHGHEHS
jgi:hypothetical protein